MSKLYTKNTWADEVLAGAERYDIKEDAGTAFKPNMQIVLATGVTTPGSPVSAARMNNLELGLDAVDTKLSDGTDLFTTGGSSTAYTITTTGAAALATGEKFRVKFNATAGATPTLNRDSKGAKNLKYYDNTGTKQACGPSTIFANTIFDVVYDGTDYIVLNVFSVRETAYKITPTVASNNLTLTLTHADGTTPSTSRPLWFNIGGTWRSITAALAVTKNAGTNWCNAGATEFATLEVDYFVYLGYNATDGVVLGFARFPYATLYSDFSTTSTNEKYAAISTITNATANDNYINIGRFNAINSGTTSYNWSMPGTSLVINYPIYKTEWRDWVPTITGFSANPTNMVHRYILDRNSLTLTVRHGTAGTSNATTFTETLPFTAKTITNQVWQFPAAVDDNSVLLTTPGVLSIGSGVTTLSFLKDYSLAAFTNAGTKRCRFGTVTYEI